MELQYQCPHCKNWIKDDDWAQETEVSCEDCGTHPALRCPLCFNDVDQVHYEREHRYFQQKSPPVETSGP